MSSLISKLSHEAAESDWIDLRFNFTLVIDLSQCTDYEPVKDLDGNDTYIFTLEMEAIARSLYGGIGEEYLTECMKSSPEDLDRNLNSRNPAYYLAGLVRARDLAMIRITDLEHKELIYVDPNPRLVVGIWGDLPSYSRPGDLQFVTKRKDLDFIRLNYYARDLSKSRELECLIG